MRKTKPKTSRVTTKQEVIPAITGTEQKMIPVRVLVTKPERTEQSVRVKICNPNEADADQQRRLQARELRSPELKRKDAEKKIITVCDPADLLSLVKLKQFEGVKDPAELWRLHQARCLLMAYSYVERPDGTWTRAAELNATRVYKMNPKDKAETKRLLRKSLPPAIKSENKEKEG